MPTQAKNVFDTNIERSGYFLKIHEDAQNGAGAPALRFRELPRASIVFTVGAVDAYLSDMSAEVLIAQLQSAPPTQQMREILKRIQNELPTLGNLRGHSIIVEIVFGFQYPADCWFRFFGGL